MNNLSTSVAYFTMEAGITPEFKNYSGGLGILSGDHVKQATQSGANTSFFSILWKKGYNLQKVTDDGTVIDVPQENELWRSYVTDTYLSFYLPIGDTQILIRIWKFNGHNLYLLDADLEENGELRKLTYNLYGGAFKDSEFERIGQEMILGIGGMIASELVLDHKPKYYHFNDGHAIFAVHKIINDYMNIYDLHLTFNDAWQKAKQVVRFTTHTNVKDGNELHSIDDLIKYKANYNLSFNQLQLLGNEDGSSNYGMTVSALHCSGKVNAVSVLHAEEANKLWKDVSNRPVIFPITNGVHRDTWQKEDIYSSYLLSNVSLLMSQHKAYKLQLVNYIKEKKGISLNPDCLIIGFARRATGYKRWNLIFKNPLSIEDLIKRYNIQLVFAGKSHQKDENGKKYLSIIHNFAKQYPDNVLFLEGYDIDMAKYLTSGCDIWLNTPLVPMEACGTSGMKAALNGVLNFSSSDGWWAEACDHEKNGWVIHSHTELSGEERDKKDAESLIYYLYTSIIPTFFDKDKWAKMMLESIKTAEYFTTERMLNDYYEKLYTE